MYKLMLVAGLVLAIAGASAAAPRGGILEVQALKGYQVSLTVAAIDVRLINHSGDDLQHWTIALEVYDQDGHYLGRGETMMSHIRAGESRVTDVLLLDVQARQIKSWRATLSGVVGYSGRREDRWYTLQVSKPQAAKKGR